MQLVSWLAFAGARDSNGDPVASGFLWAYEIGGGTTTATIYADEDGAEILAQPVTLNAAGRAVVYTKDPVRFLVQTAAGVDVTDDDEANVVRAEAVQIDNAGWTDGYIDEALTKIYESTGGTDAMYLESAGATRRTIKAKFSEISVSVKDFGASGDGLAVDTTAIQAAVNRVAFLGGGVVYFPPGDYKIDQPIVCGVSGVSLQGSGASSTVIINTGTAGNAFTWTATNGFYVRDLGVNCGSGTSTGKAFSVATSGIAVLFQGVQIDDHDVCIGLSGQANVAVTNCYLVTTDAAAARTISAASVTGLTCLGNYMYGGSGGGFCVDLSGTTATTSFSGNMFDTAGIKLNTTGTGHKFVGNKTSVVTALFTVSTAAFPTGFYQAGNGFDGYSVDVATGGATVLDLTKGRDIRIKGITGAGTVTVTNPTILPSTSDRDVKFVTRHVNAAGGACAWAMDTVFVLDAAAAIPTTDARTIIIEWLWDGTTSKLREMTRSTTVT